MLNFKETWNDKDADGRTVFACSGHRIDEMKLLLKNDRYQMKLLLKNDRYQYNKNDQKIW
jgi:hypothetical protein